MLKESRSRTARDLAHILPICTIVALAIQGCSGSPTPTSRDYPIPDKLCDVEVEPEKLTEIFPAGKTIETVGDGVSRYGWVASGGRCTVFIDDNPAISVDSFGSTDEPQSSGPRTPGVEPYLQFRNFDLAVADSEIVDSSEYEIRIWKNFAAIHIPCAQPSGMGYSGMNIAIDLRENENRDFSDVLKDIIEPYALDRIAKMGPEVCDRP
ncbi:hypothetical protein ACWD33_26770 [Streptomyces xiamenensis]|uniref:hypothetical protein n=1 Tax=Streptomyces xiamenensis TaxID=408015 RepID=UPI0035DBA144